MFRYFTKKNTERYIDILQDIASKCCSSSCHRNVKMAPKDVNKDNDTQVWVNLYKKDSLINEEKQVNLL